MGLRWLVCELLAEAYFVSKTDNQITKCMSHIHNPFPELKSGVFGRDVVLTSLRRESTRSALTVQQMQPLMDSTTSTPSRFSFALMRLLSMSIAPNCK